MYSTLKKTHLHPCCNVAICYRVFPTDSQWLGSPRKPSVAFGGFAQPIKKKSPQFFAGKKTRSLSCLGSQVEFWGVYRVQWEATNGILVGGFNPSQKYAPQIGSFPQGSGWKYQKIFELPPPRNPKETFTNPWCSKIPQKEILETFQKC